MSEFISAKNQNNCTSLLVVPILYQGSCSIPWKAAVAQVSYEAALGRSPESPTLSLSPPSSTSSLSSSSSPYPHHHYNHHHPIVTIITVTNMLYAPPAPHHHLTPSPLLYKPEPVVGRRKAEVSYRSHRPTLAWIETMTTDHWPLTTDH